MTAKQWLLCVFLILNAIPPLHAETKEEEFLPDLMILSSEEKFDLVLGQKSTQEIKVTRFIGSSVYHEIERRDPVTKELIATEIIAEWNTVSFSPGENYYTDQTLTGNYGGKKNSFFGRMEIKKISNHEIVDAWPVFGTITKEEKLTTVTMTAYMSDGGKFVYTEVFENKKTFLPLGRRSQFFDDRNNVTSDLLFMKK